MMKKIFTSLLLFLALIISVESRFITLHGSDHTDDNLISDGISSVNNVGKSTTASFQRHSYYLPEGVLFGNLFLIIIYGGLMLVAARLLSTGSELLLEILGPGIVGGLFSLCLVLFPMLYSFLSYMLRYMFCTVSGISGTKEVAQEQVLVGMGLLAGSTVMLLTLLWGSCIVLGKCDIEDSTAVDLKDTKRLSLLGSGVTVDIWTKYASWIMIISVVPFIIVQLPQILHINSGRHLVVLISLIVSVTLLISYCVYQVCVSTLDSRRKLAYAKHSHIMSGVLRHLDLVDRLMTDDDSPNIAAIKTLVIKIHFAEEIALDKDEDVQKMLLDFDTSRDGCVDETEFVKGISIWLNKARPTKGFINFTRYHTRKEHDQLLDKSDEVVEGVENPKWISIKAGLLLFVNNFSTATSIPPFFISFIVLPLATNSSEAVSALIFASRKKKRTASLTYSEIYGAVTMNNILCLSVFLALVYVRDFILIVCVVMGLFTSFHTTFPLWTCSVAYVLYPFSLVLVYLLDYKFGWT
ncbi:hypothetical protein MKW92_038291 [Papaver armeniacum]|nr:hypothetical protein MKW92_038291 [Papaver armeniacum]